MHLIEFTYESIFCDKWLVTDKYFHIDFKLSTFCQNLISLKF